MTDETVDPDAAEHARRREERNAALTPEEQALNDAAASDGDLTPEAPR